MGTINDYNMDLIKAYGVTSTTSDNIPLEIQRRQLKDDDVLVDIEYCGICHSDLHRAHGDWASDKSKLVFPLVTGHEIIGKVSRVGSKVTKHKAGDLVGVGVLIDSCRECKYCKKGEDPYCTGNRIGTYGNVDPDFGGNTQGGYSENIVVTEDFVVKIPENIYGPAAAPLLCAGITSWSPLAHWKVTKGQKVGVIGLGGLGHMGIKFAKALGAETWILTTSESKANAAKELGVDGIIFSNNKEDMAKHASSFDFLLNTVPVSHDVNPYLELLASDGAQVLVGAIEPLAPVDGGSLIRKRRTLAGSLIGGIPQIQEMLDFCGKHNIVSDIEVSDYAHINEAWARVQKNDVKYRFVLDNKTL